MYVIAGCVPECACVFFVLSCRHSARRHPLLFLQEIAAKDAEVVIAGGSESMSQAPLAVFGQNVRFNSKLLGQDLHLQDILWAALTDSHIKTPMGITAENLAEKYGITRAECDAYALRSQHTWGAAAASGVFDDEIVPLEVSIFWAGQKRTPARARVQHTCARSRRVATTGEAAVVFVRRWCSRMSGGGGAPGRGLRQGSSN